MDNIDSIWMSLAPGLIILGLMLLALAVFLIRQPDFEQAASRKSGSVLLPTTLIRYAYWLADTVVTPLGRLGVRPNHVTLFSLAFSAAAAGLVVYGHFMSAAWVLFGAMTCDLLDGLLARSLDMQTSSGAFFDSFCDRAAEGIVFAGLVYLGRDGLLFAASFWALIASYMVSYARGRGEGLGVDCKVGLMQRPERLFVLFLTLLAAPLIALGTGSAGISEGTVVLAGVTLIAVLSTVTALQRASMIMGELRERDGNASNSTSSGNSTTPPHDNMSEAPS
jgi:CDP-diacylglycerol--glycerol-3-phosphate 3-phosphatidyltransferase